jgi:capsular exopolysaccharide synthesis family protein
MEQQSELQAKILQSQADYQLQLAAFKDPVLIQAQVDEALKSDSQMKGMEEALAYYQSQLAGAQSVEKQPTRNSKILQDKVIQLSNQVAQYRAQVEQQITQQTQGTPDNRKKSLTNQYKIQWGLYAQQGAVLENGVKESKIALSRLLAKSVELETLDAKLSQSQELANDLSFKVQSMELEMGTTAKIVPLYEEAMSSENINTVEHWTIVILGGASAFGLACFAIGFVEFRSRRLDGPDQVDEGLGIRVVGTLPALSNGAIDPNHPIVAQLTDSIDSVRTILMHDSTTKRRQVVMVTSPSTMEGRTTVASQLAASLARAGRRTLLVDGDLRRPALHALFDLPLEDGLCEVLRAEVDVADVIRPTHAEGLWVLTSGYCDVDAIHALATEQMQPVFDKLRAEYDFIIVDGAPVLGMSDALIFGQYSDGAIISVRRDYSQMPKIYQTAELLRSVGVRVIGAVVNGVSAKADERVTQIRLIAPKSERVLEPA